MSSSMTYKGYTARVEFDERDNIFVGRVLGVKAIIDIHGETVAELRADFKAAIDVLLDDCKARGGARLMAPCTLPSDAARNFRAPIRS